MTISEDLALKIRGLEELEEPLLRLSNTLSYIRSAQRNQKTYLAKLSFMLMTN